MRQLLIASAIGVILSASAYANPPQPQPTTITLNPSVTVTGGGTVSKTFTVGPVSRSEFVTLKGSRTVTGSFSVQGPQGFTTP